MPYARIRLLDHSLQPVALGAVGELSVGGPGLARGYLGRPDVTAERFVPDPTGEAGERLYRTGDLARHRADGVLEYLGRADHQVKIRGFRIEPGEIEAALAEHPRVREAAVLARDFAPGDRRLVAHVAAEAGDLAAEELRGFLGEKLPAYMVPAAFAFHGELPLSANGKVDRAALALWQRFEEQVAKGGGAPRDETELVLVRIWEEVLGIPEVGVADNFFDLGGHSLLAVRLLAEIEERLGRHLSLTTLFQGPTVEQLAAFLRGGGAEEARRPIVVPIQTQGGKRPFFCVHAVGGNVFSFLELARRLGPEQPFYGLQSPEPAAMAETVEEMAASYVDAIRQVQPVGPYALGGWSMGAVVAFEMARQLRAMGETVRPLVMIDAPQPPAGQTVESVDRADLVAGFARELTGRELPIEPAELRRLGPAEQFAAVLALAKESGALPASSAAAQLTELFEIFRRNLAALAAFRPGVYEGAIDWYRASATREQEPEEGWAALAAGGLAVHLVPGDHYSILRVPQVAELAAQLRRALDEAGLPASQDLEPAPLDERPDRHDRGER